MVDLLADYLVAMTVDLTAAYLVDNLVVRMVLMLAASKAA